MVPRKCVSHALMQFFSEKHSYHGKIGALSIDANMRMSRLTLGMNYPHVHGCAMSSAFIQ
ncbi:unnamed protein product, partial [Rotaria sp. Silwood2]